jgi:hypothetical protein
LELYERQILEQWIVAEGRQGWVQDLAREVERTQTADRPRRTMKQISSKIYQTWYRIRDNIWDRFGMWHQAMVVASGLEEQRRASQAKTPKEAEKHEERAKSLDDYRQALEGKKGRDLLASKVLRLILDYCPPAHAPETLMTAVARPKSKPAVPDVDPEQTRLRWLRTQQRDLMYDRAEQRADRPFQILLTGWRDGKLNTALIIEPYKAEDPTAQEQFDRDRDLLHSWYEEITREKRPTLSAWRFYDGMRHDGFRKFREKAAAQAEFKPIVEAAEKNVPYPELPDRLSIRWEELAALVLRLRDFCLPPRDEPNQNPSLGA